MAGLAGHVAQVLLGAVNVSAAFREVTGRRESQTADATSFASGGVRERAVGPGGLTIMGRGPFVDDGTATGITALLEALQGVQDGSIITVAPAGLTEGGRAIAGRGTLSNNPVRAAITDIVLLDADVAISGPAGIGRLLRVATASNETAGTKTAYDEGFSTLLGGRAVLHRTAGTGTFDIRVQDSPDNSVWTDLATVTGSGTGGFSAAAIRTTVNRYLRVNVVTAGTSTRWVLAFMRG